MPEASSRSTTTLDFLCSQVSPAFRKGASLMHCGEEKGNIKSPCHSHNTSFGTFAMWSMVKQFSDTCITGNIL